MGDSAALHNVGIRAHLAKPSSQHVKRLAWVNVQGVPDGTLVLSQDTQSNRPASWVAHSFMHSARVHGAPVCHPHMGARAGKGHLVAPAGLAMAIRYSPSLTAGVGAHAALRAHTRGT